MPTRAASPFQELPARLTSLAQRTGLAGHIQRWKSLADGRSNQAKTEVFVLWLDVEPGTVVVKIAGSSPAARHDVANERAALALLSTAAIHGRLPVPQLYPTPHLEDGEIVMEFLDGIPLDRLAGREFDPTPLAQELLAVLPELWRAPLSSGPLIDPGLPGNHRFTSRLERLLDVVEAGLEQRLAAWVALRTKKVHSMVFTHGDLRPANVLVRDAEGVVRLAGIVDFAQARGGAEADDLVLLEELTLPVHRGLTQLLREGVSQVSDEARREARVLLHCDRVHRAAQARDWEGFARASSELDRALAS